jgi:hypothetical protein
MVQDYEKKHGFKFDWVRHPVLSDIVSTVEMTMSDK